MKIAVLSDWHLETCTGFYPEIVLEAGTDVFVVAGDVHNHGYSVAVIGELLRHRHVRRVDGGKFQVIFVPGNHDFYWAEYNQALHRMLSWAKGQDVVKNLHVLHDSSTVVEGVEFVGTTLWTDFGGDQDFASSCTRAISDFRLIDMWNPGVKISPEDVQALNERATNFLQSRLIGSDDSASRRVVVTHFCPTRLLDHPKYVGSPLKRYFHADIPATWFALADLWIFGHTHHDEDVEIYGSRVVASQMGYPGEKQHEVKYVEV